MRTRSVVSVGLVAVLLIATPAIAAPGGLDPSFGVAGKTTTAVPGWTDALASDVVVQPDGKILVAGSVRRCTDARCSDTIGRFALIRYLQDGSLDLSFGDGGYVTTSFRGTGGGSGFASGVALLPDGRILVGGDRAMRQSKSEFTFQFALARYLPDGSLDTSFGGDGKVVTGFPGDYASIDDVIALPSGRILAVGNASFVVALARYLPDGRLDRSFGDGDGRVVAARRAGFGSTGVVQPDGRIIVGGAFGDGCENKLRWSLVRFNPRGGVDATFGDRGVVHTRFATNDTGIGAVALQRDGRIVAAGYAAFQGCGGGAAGGRGPAAIVRYRPDGSRDPSFGDRGKVFTAFTSGEEIEDWYSDVAVLSDGRILGVGVAEEPDGGLEWVLARYRRDGSLDPTFGDNGKATTEFEGGLAFSPALTIDADRRPVLAGTITDLEYDNRRIGVARYLPDAR